MSKVAIVTGASRGIGKAIALRLAKDGFSVVINFSSDPAPAEELVKEIGSDKAIAIKADISSSSDIKRLVKETVDKWGKIDVLVNNAGILPMADLKGTTEETFDKTFAINVKGPYFLTQVLHSQLTNALISGSCKTHESGIDCPVLLFNHSRRIHGHSYIPLIQRNERCD